MVTLYLSLTYIITKWTCNENLTETSMKKFTLVLYEVVVEIATALQCLHLHMQIADAKR